jgi:hypothetical protein
MPFVSVVNNLFEKEDYTQNDAQDNKETNTNKKDSEDTEQNAR